MNSLTIDSPPPPSGGWLRVRQLRLVYGVAGEPPRVAVLGEVRVELGRAGHVSGPFGLEDREVSRVHAAVSWDPDLQVHVIEDLGSRNGLLVDGQKTRKAVLSAGSVVRLGRTILVYCVSELSRDASLSVAPSRLIGDGPAIARLRAEIELIAPGGLPVLVLGPTGAGKELVAEELHAGSARRGPLVPVNCAALPEELAESELFGHEAGAFTGAARAKPGLFSAAAGGTLFLDEVGELSAAVQAKLLRALARGEVRKIGASDAEYVDVRVIAATNRDLEHAVETGDFRADLLARLAGHTLRVPSLAERREDVLLLAHAFLTRAAPGATLSADAAEALLLCPWPFNVRQLEQSVRAAAVRAGNEPIVGLPHLPHDVVAVLGERAGSVAEAGTADLPLPLLVPPTAAPSKEGLALVIERLDGNLAKVAEYFGKDRRQIYRWAERLGLDLTGR